MLIYIDYQYIIHTQQILKKKKWLSLQQTISVSRYTYDQDNLRRARSRAQRNNDEPEHKKKTEAYGKKYYQIFSRQLGGASHRT